MEIEKFKLSVAGLIRKDQIRPAIDEFYAELNLNSPFYEAVIIQERNYEAYKLKIVRGIISSENQRLEMNLITHSLLEILNSLSSNDITKTILPEVRSANIEEQLKEYDQIITDHIILQKRLYVENEQLKEENSRLSSTNPVLKVKNIIELNMSLFSRFQTIYDNVRFLHERIDTNMSSVDPGFARDQIIRIESNLDGMSLISEKLSVLEEWFESKPGDQEIFRLREFYEQGLKLSRRFFGVQRYCNNGMILSSEAINRTIVNLDSIIESLSELQRAEDDLIKQIEEEKRTDRGERSEGSYSRRRDEY